MKLILKKRRIAVIFGGIGSEHSVSVKSAEYFIGLIDRKKYTVIPIYISKSGKWTLYPFAKSPKRIEDGSAVGITTYPVRLGCKSGFRLPLGLLSVDAAVPILHGVGGEDGSIQGALECAKISFVGADSSASVLCHNKAYAKTFAEALGIPTVPWIYTECGTEESEFFELMLAAERKIGYPMFIKPACEGSSFGCSPVLTRAEFAPAYRAARRTSNGHVLIEKMLEAPRELEVAYLSTKCNEIFTNPGEITYDSGFYSFEEKYSDTSSATVNSQSSLGEADEELVRAYSKSLVAALGIRHLCRIDYFLSGGKIYFNEINTIPGMTEASLYPTLIEGCGLDKEKMVCGLIEAALAL